MRKFLFLVTILATSYFPVLAQPSTQKQTATYLNNLNQFRQVYGDLNYPRVDAQDLANDDNIYGCTRKLTAIKDSTSGVSPRSVSTLALQGFGFTIPDDANIENISVKLRRYKSGRPTVGDHTVSLMQRFDCDAGICRYGVFWTYKDDYPGKIYPDAETEYSFQQAGSGNDGGFNHTDVYQWTPAIVNAITFGVRIDSYAPIGKGTVQICYDFVEVTIEYSQPLTKAPRSINVNEVKPSKEPIIYPNPFSTKTNLQFTAAENGKTTIELYDITGTKVRVLYSGETVLGQVYNVTIGDALLPKGVFIYIINNGRMKQTGKIIKLE